ncbi:hypothetical protein [Massilia sp. MS-15]|uniref:hypothetical protein n=1 Tax=Massilia sp. MS-15 TaxID=2878200 RepID=UPI001CD6B9E0|nr:hypothetical protein [Massilia sp. MS-15]MCA1246586.1 hypothetical protein [Massilia sp. MS-15]
MSNLERKWWFAGLSGAVGTACTWWTLRAAGIGSPDGVAQWLVYFCCFIGFTRAFSFLAWLALLLARPSSPLLDSAPGRRPGAKP